MPAAAVIPAAVAIGGAVAGSNQANKERKAAQNLRDQALSQFAGLDVPDIEKMKLFLEDQQVAGTLTPEMVELISQGDTALAGVSTDPRLRQSQLASLTGLEELANRGMSSADLAAFELARRNAAGEAQAKQNQILQNMQQRGQGGSGAELLASLQNAQSGADRLQEAQLQEAQQRQASRMAALQQQSNVASNLRNADYQEAANTANARDAIARFNAQNAQNVNQLNTGARNQAQQQNLTNLQNVRNVNTATANQEQMANKSLFQQDYNNRLGLANARAGQLGTGASAKDQAAGQTAGMYAGIGQGLGTILASSGNK